MNSRGWS